MNSLLFGLALSAVFSVTSLLVVIFRVSPLLAPTQAIPAFFISLFLSVATVGALAMIGIWRVVPIHTWDMGKVMSVSLRQGIFLAIATEVLLLFHLLNLLNWWIAIMIYAVFLLIELALDY
jgi:hypothetical protein